MTEIRHKFDGLPGASYPQPDLFKGFATDEIGADAVKNHRGAQSDLFEAAAIGNPDEMCGSAPRKFARYFRHRLPG